MGVGRKGGLVGLLHSDSTDAHISLSVLPVPACQAECEEAGTAGSEGPTVPSCPSSPGSQRPCWKFAGLPEEDSHIESAAGSSPIASVAHCASLTLDGGRADDERLLEGLGLGAELGGPGLQGHALLREARDVDGGLLVEARLVVEQRDVAAEGQRLAAGGGHLQDTAPGPKPQGQSGGLGALKVFEV